MSSSLSQLEWALAYAKKGRPVFPCGRNKQPVIPKKDDGNGYKDATTDEATIRAWWAKYPNAGIGMPTGTVSGWLALDIDPRHGGLQSLEILVEEHGLLPATLHTRTGGGGDHYFFQVRGLAIASTKLAPGIDIKAEGGYVILPPSPHPSGKRYEWASDEKTAISDLPLWLNDLLSNHKPPKAAANGNRPAGKISKGQRNPWLFKRACGYRNKGDFSETIFEKLKLDNQRCEPPKTADELRDIAERAARYESAEETCESSAEKTSGQPDRPPDEPKDSPIITIMEGEYPRATDEAEEILLRHAEEEGIFQRAGEIIHIIKLPKAHKSAGWARPAGTVMLKPMSLPTLMEILERRIHFYKVHVTPAGLQPYRVNCPSRVATAYLSRLGSWRLSTLTGIITSPIMRLDGTILTKNGYDEETGLYLAESFPIKIIDEPSLDDARTALETLCAPFRQFPFVKEEHRSVAIAAILTGLERRLLPACPLFAYSAPTQRSGKTLLAEAAAILATGKPAPASAVSPDKEEFRKALTSALREGQSCLNLDNIEHPLQSPDLAKIITQPEFSDRVLGESKTLCLPTNVLWTCTGNNIVFKGDLATRTLLCRIDANIERPEQREFEIPDLKTYLLENRAELVAAALTILRAFHCAGRPVQRLSRWGGFDFWSDFVRAPLVWVGAVDPCLTREGVIDDDPDRENAASLLQALRQTFADDSFTFRSAIKLSNDSPDSVLHDALLAVAGRKNKNEIDPRTLGWWCRHWRDRVLNGLQLHAEGEEHRATKWKVVAP